MIITLTIKVVEMPADPTVCFISVREYPKMSAPNGTNVCKKYSTSDTCTTNKINEKTTKKTRAILLCKT